MKQSNFREELRALMSRRPQLGRALQAALREETFRRRKAAVDRHYLVWQSLMKLEELAPEALELIRTCSDDVEPWHEHKIALATEYLEAVIDSLRCKAEHEVEDPMPDAELGGSNPPEIAEPNLDFEDLE